MWKLMLPVVAMLGTGCVQTGGSADPCAGWKPINLDDASIDGLTERDAVDILSHNEFGRKRKCW